MSSCPGFLPSRIFLMIDPGKGSTGPDTGELSFGGYVNKEWPKDNVRGPQGP